VELERLKCFSEKDIQKKTAHYEERVRCVEEEARREKEMIRTLQHSRNEDARHHKAYREEQTERYTLSVGRLTERAEKAEQLIREKDAKLAHLSVSSNKGNAVERELIDGLETCGLFSKDTSKGLHRTHYHDILVAAKPLHDAFDQSKVPRYDNKASRRNAVALLMTYLKLLKEIGYTPRDESFVGDRASLDSLYSEKRSNCTIFKNKEQYEAGKAAVEQELPDSSRKRKRAE